MRRAQQIPLHDLLEYLRANQFHPLQGGDAANSNSELVTVLQRNGSIKSDGVHRALLACPRGLFVPPGYEQQAYRDSPIRVEESRFNISAPHMHATALEHLALQPGDRFLDVGCGCGVLTACAAMLVGPTGEVCGIDVLDDCIDLCTNNLEKLKAQSEEFASSACEVRWLLGNAFLPPGQLLGRFNTVHVGATAPRDKVAALLRFLAPEGGRLLVPVDSDLCLYTRDVHGKLTKKIVTQVRFQDLEKVPNDARLVLHSFAQSEAARLAISVPPSSLDSDMCDAGASVKGGTYQRDGYDEWDSGCADACARDQSACDVALVGDGFALHAHKAVLRARCEQFRAAASSGMRDADAPEVCVPDAFSEQLLRSFLQYVYHDTLPPAPDPQTLAELLHAASYFGVPRLASLCEAALCSEVLHGDEAAAVEAAPHLLVLAHEHGLDALKRATLDFVVRNFSAVRSTEAYAALPRELADDVTAEAVRKLCTLQEAVEASACTVSSYSSDDDDTGALDY